MEGLHRGREEESIGGRGGMEAVLFLERLHHHSLPPSPLVFSHLPSLVALPLPTSALEKNERACLWRTCTLGSNTHRLSACPDLFFKIQVRKHKVSLSLSLTHSQSHDVRMFSLLTAVTQQTPVWILLAPLSSFGKRSNRHCNWHSSTFKMSYLNKLQRWKKILVHQNIMILHDAVL